MSSTEHSVRLAICTNRAACARAVAGESLEWYSGPGEYCPECGEALTRVFPSDAPTPKAEAPQTASAPDRPAPVARPQPQPPSAGDGLGKALQARRSPWPLRWLWLVAGGCILGAALLYAGRRDATVARQPADAIAICPLTSAPQFAADLVAGYVAKNALSADRFLIADPNTAACDIRFSTTAETPEAVIARDGIVAIVNPLNPIARISENQLRGIFTGSIRDWSQVGGSAGTIVAVLPSATSDEGRMVAASLFFGVAIAPRVRRAGSSSDVTRAVTGADRSARSAIGLVAFSQAISAKVVPLTYLPPPNVLTIATHYYPYTMTIALHTASHRYAGAVAALIQYARSRDGVAIVQKDGLVPPEGQ